MLTVTVAEVRFRSMTLMTEPLLPKSRPLEFEGLISSGA